MQTLREALDKWPVWGKHASDDGEDEAFCAGWKSAWAMLDREGLLDLTIIDGVAVALDLEAGIDAAQCAFNHIVEPVTGEIAIDLHSFVKAILTACNIIVPDEVGTGRFCAEWEQWPWLEDEKGNRVLDLNECSLQSENTGEIYTITITRKSTLQPQVNEEE